MSYYMHNKLSEVRPGSTFGNFEINDPSQGEALHALSSLAKQIIAAKKQIAAEKYPFPEAMLLFLHGKPGLGKTHLVESFINEIKQHAPEVYNRMILSRGRFVYDWLVDVASPYGDAPIVVLDDIFQNHMSVDSLTDITDVQAFMRLITDLYDNHRLVIATSNFPLLNGLLERVARVDTIGRTISRAKEVMSMTGEIELLGPDFREIIAQRRSQDRQTFRLRGLPTPSEQ